MNLIKLSLSYIRGRKLNSLLNILLFALGIGTIALLTLFSKQFSDKITRDAKDIDMVVGAKGSKMQLMLSGIYQMDVPTGNMPYSEYQKLKRNPILKKVIPISMGDSYQQYRIIGTTPEYPDHYGAKVQKGKMFADLQEVVLGAQVAKETGFDLGKTFAGAHAFAAGEHHEAHPFKVVGILAETGTVLDRLILTDYKSVWAVHELPTTVPNENGAAEADAHGHEEHATESASADSTALQPLPVPNLAPPSGLGLNNPNNLPPQEITLALVQFASPMAAITLPRYLNSQTPLQAARPAEEMTNLLQMVGFGVKGLRFFGWILMITAALSIFVALYNALKERRYDLAVMRSLGASPQKLMGHILLEGVIYALVGAVIGLILGHLALYVLTALFSTAQQAGISAWRFTIEEVYLLGLAVLVGFFAALIPAIQAYKTDIAKTLSE